jgi:hypothetical protein
MTDHAISAHDVTEVLHWIPTSPDYDTWLRTISAVGNTLPETEAEAALLAWSPDKVPGETRRKLRHRLAKVRFGSLVEIARKHGFDPRAWHRERGSVRRQYAARKPRRIVTPLTTLKARKLPISGNELAVWEEGAVRLNTNPKLCAEIDQWRGYPSGTASELAASDFIAAPRLRGQRAIAFAVIDHKGRQIGFHARHEPPEGERAAWSYHPTGTPALPFVLGAGFARSARRVIVTEGQWDAIALAAALGWLAHDTAFDEHTVIFGTRGASGTGQLLAEWFDVIPPDAEWRLFRDADKAGYDAFVKLATELRRHGRTVTLHRPGTGKDVNDVLRDSAVTWEEIWS